MVNRVCERCIHYDVCLLHEDNFIDDVAKNGFCGKFRDKADVVEVVRCKECKHSSFIKSCSKYECKKGCGSLKYSNDYCSYGERKCNDD